MTAAADPPSPEAAEHRRPLTVDWTEYAQTAELTESVRETGDVPATVPDRLVLDGIRTLDLERGSWSITCTGHGVAMVDVRVRARDIRVDRSQSRRPRVFLDGVRVLVPDSSVPDSVGVSREAWVAVRFFTRLVTVTSAGATRLPQALSVDTMGALRE